MIRMQKKIHLLAFMFIALIFIFSSCDLFTEQSNQGTRSSRTATGKGVEISFARNIPPDIIYVDGEHNPNIKFEVVVDIRNLGAYPKLGSGSLNGKIFLTGFDADLIEGGNWVGGNQFNLIEAVSDDLPEGGVLQKNFVANGIYYPYRSREYPINLVLTACYYYETEALGSVCIDPNPASLDNKVCEFDDVKLSEQLAPVQVTRIQQSGTSNQLILTIDIKNLGSGVVLREFAREGQGVLADGRCLNLGYDDADRLGLEIEIVGIGKGDCRPMGVFRDPIRLFDDAAQVICTFQLPEDITSEFSSQMNIKLNYGYLTSETKQIKIVNLDVR